ncbi:MAG: alpha-D-ribose 1-methylphosphonate 5-triphosphate diphosphatase [Deltaproteobacteria bacterium]|jgi:alpha-D-ribose 1-methylphosphonate 5-triphosphate diphosphatase|nr:alpha-D-ribose 1-methylphosphonate 5-triphosphate diphosphatase [Deltaproteobacteria bacterium]
MSWTAVLRTEEAREHREELVFTNGNFVTPSGVVAGHMAVKDGVIADVAPGFVHGGIDLKGDLAIPGLVELHTDNLEKHIMPRPGIYWSDPASAVEAHDAQLVSSGITTVFDSVCVGEPVDKGRRRMLAMSLNAINKVKDDLRATHLIHLRCEISDPNMAMCLEEALSLCRPDIISVMDHTPGQRQWRTPKDWLVYHQAKLSDEELRELSKTLKEARDTNADKNIAMIAEHARVNNVTLATHDDTDETHVEEALRLGARISEFPTTMTAAKLAREKGLFTVLGTPNLVRGASHSGNVKAAEVARAGYLSCLSSDYVPASLVHGAFKLHREEGFSLSDAVATVTRNPAEAAGLKDRGALVRGLRADFARVRVTDGRPRIMEVWVKGERAY